MEKQTFCQEEHRKKLLFFVNIPEQHIIRQDRVCSESFEKAGYLVYIFDTLFEFESI